MARIRGLGGQVLTLVVVSLTVMCLRAGSLDGIGNLMTSLFRPDPGPIGAGLLLKLAIASLIALAAPNTFSIHHNIPRLSSKPRVSAMSAG